MKTNEPTKTAAIGIRMSLDLWDFYRKEAQAQGTSVSDRIRRVLERHKEALEKYEKQ